MHIWIVAEGIIRLKEAMADPTKVQYMCEWPTPTFVECLNRFLRLSGYYRKFVWVDYEALN